ncbi:hypothetical protein ACK2FW_21370 [Clostridioides difficile]
MHISDTQVFGGISILLSYFRNNVLNIQMAKEEHDDEIMKKYPVDFISFSCICLLVRQLIRLD